MDLQTRVRDQFQHHPDLRVLFFFDADEAYSAEVEAWSDPSIRCVKAGEEPRFSLKYELEHERNGEQVLLYFDRARPASLEGFPLAGLLVANRELHIDRLAQFLETYGLGERHRALAEKYFKGELEYKNRQEVLRPVLNSGRFSEKNVQRGLAAYHLEAVRFKSVPSEEELLAAIFVEAADHDRFEAYRAGAHERDLAGYLGHLFASRFALDEIGFDYDQVRAAAERFKYNLLLQPIEERSPEDPYARQLAIDDAATLSGLRSIAQVWEQSATIDAPYDAVLDALASGVDERKLARAYGTDANFGYLTAALRRARLEEAARQVRRHPSRTREGLIAPLRKAADEGMSVAADLLWHVASYYRQMSEYPSLEWSDPARLWDAYTERLYACDRHYRRAALAYRRLQTHHARARATVEDVYQRFLGDYDAEFVTPLNVAWQRALEAQVERGEALPGDPLGTFYAEHVGEDPPKTAVIISDGLRYEAAEELARRLGGERRKEAHLKSVRAPLPSVTSLGKASHLPHASIGWNGSGFTIDGKRTGGTEAREAVLQEAMPDARALTYEEAIALGIGEGRALFKEHPLAYIYHDRIDAIGDKRETEGDTPRVVGDAMEEIFRLVRTLNNFNVYRVLITSDHGFLYSERDVPEAQQEKKYPDVEGEKLKRNRCIVAEKVSGKEGYRFPVRAVSTVDADWTVAVPRAVNRYPLQGSGKRYAHGGASLQEMTVPVIEVLKARTDRAEKVSVRLLTQKRSITSGVLKVQLVQGERVSNRRRARTLLIGLYDDQGELVSREEEIAFDATSSAAPDRTRQAMLELQPAADDLNACRLLAYDRDDKTKLNPVIEERFTIQRLFGRDDF